MTLTRKQQTVFEYLQRYMGEHRQSPLIREIQEGCHIVSYKSALDRLNALERRDACLCGIYTRCRSLSERRQFSTTSQGRSIVFQCRRTSSIS